MSEREKETISRRAFLRGLGAAAAGLVASGCVPRLLPQASSEETGSGFPTQPAPEVTPVPEKEPRSPIAYGFNTHLSAEPGEKENMTLATFKEDVDRMVTLGMEAIRFNVQEWELDTLEPYDEAIAYAKERGMRIYLVTNVPGLSENGADLAGDLEKTRAYYQRLATRWQGQVDVWQVFNESDDHTYYNYRRIENAPEGESPYPLSYLRSFGQIVGEASRTIKAIDPQARTTINVSMWVGSDAWVGADNPRPEEVLLFNAVEGVIDLVSLDPYLDTNEEAIERFPEVVKYFETVYQKPVVIAELGLPTGDGRFSQADQGRFIAMAIDALQAGKVRPEAVLLYEFRDESMRAGAEASFGFFNAQGQPKEGLGEVLEAIEEEDEQDEKK